MLERIKRAIKKLIAGDKDRILALHWVKKGEDTWLARQLPGTFIRPAASPFSKKIEHLARETNKAGPQPLWKGYEGNNIAGATRTPDAVSTNPSTGNFYTWLVQMWK